MGRLDSCPRRNKQILSQLQDVEEARDIKREIVDQWEGFLGKVEKVVVLEIFYELHVDPVLEILRQRDRGVTTLELVLILVTSDARDVVDLGFFLPGRQFVVDPKVNLLGNEESSLGLTDFAEIDLE